MAYLLLAIIGNQIALPLTSIQYLILMRQAVKTTRITGGLTCGYQPLSLAAPQARCSDYSATPEGAFSFHLIILFMIWIN